MDYDMAGSDPDIDMSKVIAVTNRMLCQRPFLEQIERICSQRPGALILREKDLGEEAYLELAASVAEICLACQVECILHTYPNAAKSLGIKKIHLPLHIMRKLSTEERAEFEVTGCSVHSMAEAKEAQSLGAAYLTAGHIYATDCKRGLPPRGLGFLEEICERAYVPVYAIGGIRLNQQQIREVLDRGAAGVCVMSAMMQV